MLPPTERFAANYFWAQLCGQLNFVTQHFENIKGLLAVLALLIICHSLTTLKEPQKPRRTVSISQCLEWTEFRIVLVLKWHVCPKQLLWLEVVTEKSALKAISFSSRELASTKSSVASTKLCLRLTSVTMMTMMLRMTKWVADMMKMVIVMIHIFWRSVCLFVCHENSSLPTSELSAGGAKWAAC